MAIGCMPCSLCKDSFGGRASALLSDLYARIMQLPDKSKKREIASLLRTKPCALAKMATLYRSRELADAFSQRFSEEHSGFRECRYRGSSALADGVPVCEIAAVLNRYLEMAGGRDDEFSRVGFNRLRYLVEDRPISDYSTDQGTRLAIMGTIMGTEAPPNGLRIVDDYK